jgi:hypothetical protein
VANDNFREDKEGGSGNKFFGMLPRVVRRIYFRACELLGGQVDPREGKWHRKKPHLTVRSYVNPAADAKLHLTAVLCSGAEKNQKMSPSFKATSQRTTIWFSRQMSVCDCDWYQRRKKCSIRPKMMILD